MLIYRQNLLHAQEFEKYTYNKNMKAQSYVPDKKIWLSSKYINMK